MRKARFLLSLVMMVGPTAAGVIACGGDSNDAAGGGTLDASTAQDSSVVPPEEKDAAPSPSASAKATAVTKYLGHVIELDGSSSTGSTTLAFAWTVTSTPAGSAVSTATLTGAATAKPSFLPDRVGAFTLTLKVTSGAAESSATVTATVVDPPVFYFHDEADASSGEQFASLNVVGATEGDGGGMPVRCLSTDAGSYGGLIDDVAGGGADWWEAPAGQPSKAVFIIEVPGDGGVRAVLASARSNEACGAPAAFLDEAPGPAASAITHPFEQPRLSPNGARVAYARNGEGGARIATVGFDGAAPRLVAPYGADADGGPNPDAGFAIATVGPRPVWANDSTVAWLQGLDESRWQIVSAPDQTGAIPSVVMACSGPRPSQFDLLPNGEVIVSQLTGAGSTAVVQIQAYSVTAGTKECGTARDVSKLTSTNGGSRAYDFSLSPDKSSVAYLAYDDGAGSTNARVARVDGTSAPISVGTLKSGIRGPRWVGDGAFLTWGLNAVEFDGGPGSSEAIGVATVDGGSARIAAWRPDGTGTSAIGNGLWSCTFAPVGSGASLFGIVGILGLRLVRRRRSS